MELSRSKFRSSADKFLILLTAMSLGWTASAQEGSAGQVLAEVADRESSISDAKAGALASLELDLQSWKQVHPTSVLTGRLTAPIYAGRHVVVPEGTNARLTIKSIEKITDKSGIWKKVGRGIVRALNPLGWSVAPEYKVEIASAEIITPAGNLPISAEVLRAGLGTMIRPAQKPRNRDTLASAQSASSRNAEKPHPLMLLRCSDTNTWFAPNDKPSQPASETLGEHKVRAFLLNELGASHTRDGYRFQAVIAEPVRVGGHAFEAGSLLEGIVERARPPRILSRAGSLSLHFNSLTSAAHVVAINGTLGEVEAATRNSFILDDEGRVNGRKPNAKSAIIGLVLAYAIGKGADDLAETPIRAIGAATSDAAVANTARYFGLAAAAIFLITRHGRDVYLPKYAELEVELGTIEEPSGPTNSSPPQPPH